MTAIILEKRGPQAWITINRPAQRNVLNGEAFLALADAWQELREDAAIRVVVITAAGEEDFCCGGDLSEVIPLWTGARSPAGPVEERLQSDVGVVDRVMLKDEPLLKPVVAAVNGRALGGGTELLLATDIRIAADSAQFGLPEPKVGIVPGAGSMVRLTRQLPWAHAMKLLLAAEPVSAQEALQMGLVSEVLPLAQLQARAEYYADLLCTRAPLALQAIKRTALETHTQSWADAFGFEMAQAGQVMMSADAREGTRAFRDKRPPDFKGE